MRESRGVKWVDVVRSEEGHYWNVTTKKLLTRSKEKG